MGAILWYALPYGTQFYAGTALERIGAILALVALGMAVFFAAGVWAIYRIARGWLALRDLQPMYANG